MKNQLYGVRNGYYLQLMVVRVFYAKLKIGLNLNLTLFVGKELC